MGYLLFLAMGAWTLYVAWRGIVPESRILWGKSEAGHKMRRGQRLLFGVGGALIFGMGVLGYFLRTK
jgi:hypothetical protein